MAPSKGEIGPQFGKVCIIQGWNWANLYQGWPYPKVNLGPNRARLALSSMLALSKGGFGPNSGQVGIIQKRNWAKIDQSWHYPKVNLGQNRARLARSSMLTLPKGGFGPKVANPRNYRRFQGWIWTSRAPSAQRLLCKFKY